MNKVIEDKFDISIKGHMQRMMNKYAGKKLIMGDAIRISYIEGIEDFCILMTKLSKDEVIDIINEIAYDDDDK